MSVPRKNRRKLWLFLPLATVIAAVLWAWHPWQPRIVIHTSSNPKDGAAMVWVPAGTFRMGSGIRDGLRDAAGRRDWRAMRDVAWGRLRGAKEGSDESPYHTVYLDGYWIYQYEVTVAQYRQFCRVTGRAMPDTPPWGWRDDDPIVNVTWHDAVAYAAWAGASLPTEAQWEKAARGPDGRVYPWGNAWGGARCCNSVDGSASSPSPVGSFPAGAGPYGAQDLAGNVWEWCADWYDETYYQHAPRRNPAGPATGAARVLRGGSWGYSDPRDFRTTLRTRYIPPLSWSCDLGFRCAVRSPGPSEP
ncbi:MAG: formylglycine-generating enzyme family protein [Armatimonadota bacterium]